MFLVIRMPKTFYTNEFEANNQYSLFEAPTEAINDTKHGAEGSPFRHTIYKCHKLADAKSLASKLVEENAGYEIWIAPASFVMQGTKPEVIEKQITENGVLPT